MTFLGLSPLPHTHFWKVTFRAPPPGSRGFFQYARGPGLLGWPVPPRSLEPPDVPLSSLDDAGCFLSPVGQAQFSDSQCGAAELWVRPSARMFARWPGRCRRAVSTRQSPLSSWQGDRSPKEGLSVFGAAGPWTQGSGNCPVCWLTTSRLPAVVCTAPVGGIIPGMLAGGGLDPKAAGSPPFP